MKPAHGKCPPEKILDHFKNTSIKQVLLTQLLTKNLPLNLPQFVCELNISNNFPNNHKVQTMDEIQKHLSQLKSGKAICSVNPELLKKFEVSRMLQVIHRMANYSVFLPLKVLLDL